MPEYFKKIIWTRDRIDHISRHGIQPDDVEEAVFDDPNRVVRKGGRALRSPDENVYFVYGVTMSWTFFVCCTGGSAWVHGISGHRPENDGEREAYVYGGERVSNLADKKREVPDFDTIEKLAEFWDTHDSTDFTLKETAAVFECPDLEQISIRLPKPVLARLKADAQALGIGHTTLARVIITRHLSQRPQ